MTLRAVRSAASAAAEAWPSVDRDSRLTMATAYMTASTVRKTTDPRARPVAVLRRTGYIATAIPAHANAAMSRSSEPAATRSGSADSLPR